MQTTEPAGFVKSSQTLLLSLEGAVHPGDGEGTPVTLGMVTVRAISSPVPNAVTDLQRGDTHDHLQQRRELCDGVPAHASLRGAVTPGPGAITPRTAGASLCTHVSPLPLQGRD